MIKKIGRSVAFLALALTVGSGVAFANSAKDVAVSVPADIKSLQNDNISDINSEGSARMYNFKEKKYVYVKEPPRLTKEDGLLFIPEMDEAVTIYQLGIDSGKAPINAVMDTYSAVLDVLKKTSELAKSVDNEAAAK